MTPDMSTENNQQTAAEDRNENRYPGLDTPELVTVAEFIQQTLPFNELPEEILYPVISRIVIQYHCQGDAFDARCEEAAVFGGRHLVDLDADEAEAMA